MNKGRPKKIKELEQLSFKCFQEDISMFRNGLLDSLDDEDENNELEFSKRLVSNFLKLDVWQQNLYIVYLLNKDKRVNNNQFTFKALAEMLQVERGELMKALKEIKNQLISETQPITGV